jgi:hypothetical protein
MSRFSFVAVLLLLAVSLNAAAQNRSTELDQAHRDLVAAQRALEEARERREEVRIPNPDDRIGIASGKSRLLPEYFEEQRRAERAVIAAEERYHRALERWQQLR